MSKSEIWLPILVTIAISAITWAITTYEFNKSYDAAKLQRLNDNINKIEDINLQYPFIEDSAFIARWEKNKYSNTDSALRYTTYCEYVFNFIQDVSEYFDYDKKKIEKFVNIKSLIKDHRGWWDMPETDTTNVEPYPEKLIELINYYKK